MCATVWNQKYWKGNECRSNEYDHKRTCTTEKKYLCDSCGPSILSFARSKNKIKLVLYTYIKTMVKEAAIPEFEL